MSHLLSVDLKVLDLAGLQDAVTQCGGELVLNTTKFRSYTGLNPCAHLIRLPGVGYEIGVVPAKDGVGYELSYDNWGVHGQALERQFGRGLGTLKDEYGCSVAARALARKGYAVSRQKNAVGELQLVAVKR